jgi:hypothetical protein
LASFSSGFIKGLMHQCCSSRIYASKAENTMSRWYLPLTVLGLGSLGVLFGTDRGRRALERASDFLEDLPQDYSEWMDMTDREIAEIQSAVNQIADSLGAGALQPAS